jgi:SPASM domain peptide maturase of grasp-with-spasm system
MINKKFQLFQCCIPVKGFKTGLIIDFQRKSFHRVPNQIIDYIEEYKNKNLYELFFDFKNNKDILKKYIQYFIDNELLIISDNLDVFPKIDTSFIRPFSLDVVCLEIVNFNIYTDFFKKNTLDELGVKSLKIIIKTNVIYNLIKILKVLENSKIQTITLFLKYENEIELKIEKLKHNNPRLMEVIFFGCDNPIKTGIDNFFYYDSLSLEKSLYKGVQNSNNFILDLNVYIESLNYNFSFNRVLFIDEFGKIRRYISDTNNYGDVSKKNDLNNALINNEILDFWKVSKDKIEICKDCEYRYICSDGRIPFKERNEDIFYQHKVKCNYDPYKNEWINQI